MIIFFSKNYTLAIVILGVISIYLIFIAISKNPGYCSVGKRYISDEGLFRLHCEKIKAQ